MATVRVPVDGQRITLVSTGKVHPVPVFENGRPVDGAQERDRDTGFPLWSIDVVVDQDDAQRSEAVGVRMPAADAPVITKWQPVTFDALVMAVRNYKADGTSAYWYAAGVVAAPGRPARSGE